MNKVERIAMGRLNIRQKDLQERQLTQYQLYGSVSGADDETIREIHRQLANMQGAEKMRVERLRQLVQNEMQVIENSGITEAEYKRYYSLNNDRMQGRAFLRSNMVYPATNSQISMTQECHESSSGKFSYLHYIDYASFYEGARDKFLGRLANMIDNKQRKHQLDSEFHRRAANRLGESAARVEAQLQQVDQARRDLLFLKATKYSDVRQRIQTQDQGALEQSERKRDKQYHELERRARASSEHFRQRCQSAVHRARQYTEQNQCNMAQVECERVKRLSQGVDRWRRRMDAFQYTPLLQIDYEKQAQRAKQAQNYIRERSPARPAAPQSTRAEQINMLAQMRRDKSDQATMQRQQHRQQWLQQVAAYQQRLAQDLAARQDAQARAAASPQQQHTTQPWRERAASTRHQRQEAARARFLTGQEERQRALRDELDEKDRTVRLLMDRKRRQQGEVKKLLSLLEATDDLAEQKRIIEAARAHVDAQK